MGDKDFCENCGQKDESGNCSVDKCGRYYDDLIFRLNNRIDKALVILENRNEYAPTAARIHAAAVLRSMTIEDYFKFAKENEHANRNTD